MAAADGQGGTLAAAGHVDLRLTSGVSLLVRAGTGAARSGGVSPLERPERHRERHREVTARRIASFIQPLGYSFNLDGTTLYLSLAAVFVAQAAGVELRVGQQISMLLTLMPPSKGVAGVPRASLSRA